MEARRADYGLVGLGGPLSGAVLRSTSATAASYKARSSVESIFAIGDVTDRLNLTPVATAEGMWLAKTLFGGEPTPVDHENVPTAVFADPNVATVGLSEEAARERFAEVDIYRSTFRALKYTLGERTDKTFMKLVVDATSIISMGGGFVYALLCGPLLLIAAVSMSVALTRDRMG